MSNRSIITTNPLPAIIDDVHNSESNSHASNAVVDSEFLKLFMRLVEETPTDQNGFLLYLIDHCVLPEDILDRDEKTQQELFELAKIQVDNSEGYPAFDFAMPLWNKLPHEPDSYYQAFRIYMSHPGRDLSEAQERITPGFDRLTIKEAYVLYYWHERAKAYDIYRPVAASRLKDQRLLLMEDTHYQMSDHLLKTLASEIDFRSEAQEKRPWKGLSSAELIKSMTMAAELQRTSLGLPAKGPKQRDENYSPAALTSVQRATKEGVKNYTGKSSENVTQADEMRENINSALKSDPETAERLQNVAMEILLQSRKLKEAKQNNEKDI
jgi:hypothetical protein